MKGINRKTKDKNWVLTNRMMMFAAFLVQKKKKEKKMIFMWFRRSAMETLLRSKELPGELGKPS